MKDEFVYLVNDQYLTEQELHFYCEEYSFEFLEFKNNCEKKVKGKRPNKDCYNKEELSNEFPFYYSLRHTNDNIDEY